jgi:hypothetical protein
MNYDLDLRLLKKEESIWNEYKKKNLLFEDCLFNFLWNSCFLLLEDWMSILKICMYLLTFIIN